MSLLYVLNARYFSAVVRKGQVVDQGTHMELVKRGGFYATLVAKQSLVAEDFEQTEEVKRVYSW